jgi:DNA-binding MarR family transcriptional regulator
MSTTRRVDEHHGLQLPLLGGLLRLCHQELLNEVVRALDEAGMGDVRPAQYAVCQQLGANPEGLRLTELAAYAGITKPSMSALVDGLEQSGYVERVPDERDQRAQLVRFTARGRAFSSAALRAVTRFERVWADRIGARDLEALRRILRTIIETRPLDGEARPSRGSPPRRPR